MEISKQEVGNIERTSEEAAQIAVIELSGLQLVMVGGGSADVHFG